MQPNAAFAIVLAGLAGTPSAAFAEYDDPAVALCEVAAKARLPQDAVYRRTSAAIDGPTVTIGYTTQVLNTAPKPGTFTCRFRYSGDDHAFFLDVPPMPGPRDCAREVESLEPLAKKMRTMGLAPGSAERARHDAALAAVDACRARPQPGAQEFLAATHAQSAMAAYSIYPIGEADTALPRP